MVNMLNKHRNKLILKIVQENSFGNVAYKGSMYSYYLYTHLKMIQILFPMIFSIMP